MRYPVTCKYVLCLCTGFLLGLAASHYSWTHTVDTDLEREQVQKKRLEPCIQTPKGEEQLNRPQTPVPSSSSDHNCVCGIAAERLKRLAKLALYVRDLNSSNQDCGHTPPTASPEDADELRRFLYPSDKRPVVNYRQAKEVLHNYEPKTLEEEYVFKKQLFVAVLTQQDYLPTRAKSLYETWGKDVDKLVFFVGEDCNISAELSYLPIVKLTGIPDHVYPPLRKTFAVMKYMYEHYTYQFNWFIRADDDMYLRVDKLKDLLTKIHPYDNVYMGRAGTGRKDDLKRLLLLPHEKYCMGGPGIIFSTAALRELGPHLSNCLEAGELPLKSKGI